jgi:hypothetical protein
VTLSAGAMTPEKIFFSVYPCIKSQFVIPKIEPRPRPGRGRDPKYFQVRDRGWVATGTKRPVFKFLGRDRLINFWVATYGLMVPNTNKVAWAQVQTYG